jgi:outer membrane protein
MFVQRSTAGWGVAAALAAALAVSSCAQYTFPANPEPYVGPTRPAPVKGETPPAKPGEAPAVAAPPAKGGPVAVPPGPVNVSVAEAVFLAMANNQALAVQRYNTPIKRTFEENAAAVFDPDLTGSLGLSRNRGRRSMSSPFSLSKGFDAAVGYSQLLPSGTTLEATAETSASLAGDDFFSTRVGMTVTQALMRGYGADVNLASLRQAKLDTLTSEYELRAFAEALLAQVEAAYWDYALAQRNIEIFDESLKVAQKQLNETNERIRVGKLAEIERAAAEAEVALRQENLINARSALATKRLGLLRLLNPGNPDFWSRPVTLKTLPTVPEIQLEKVEEHVQVALRMRPDLNQARVTVQRDDLELVKTRNGLLPRMDVFLTLGKTGYADSFFPSAGRVAGSRGYDASVGMSFESPLLNRDATAKNQRAHLGRQQAAESVANVEQLVQLDVRGAYIEIERSKEQVAATAVTRKLQEEALRAEMEKFQVGKSTNLLVIQAQRDLLQSQINEVQAVVAYLKAWVELYRLEGSLLERRGIECPGRQPAEMPPARL